MIHEKSARVTCGRLNAGDLPVECDAEGTGKLITRHIFDGIFDDRSAGSPTLEALMLTACSTAARRTK